MQGEQRQAEQEAAQGWHDHRAHRLQHRLGRQPFAVRDVEKNLVEQADGTAHQHHEKAAQNTDDRREDDQAGFPRADQRAQTARRFQI